MLGPPPHEWDEPPGYRNVTVRGPAPPLGTVEPAGYRVPVRGPAPPLGTVEPAGYRVPVRGPAPPLGTVEPAGYRDPVMDVIRERVPDSRSRPLAVDASLTKEYIPPEDVLSEVKSTLATIDPGFTVRMPLYGPGVPARMPEGVDPGFTVRMPLYGPGVPERIPETFVKPPALPYQVHYNGYSAKGVSVDPVAVKIQEQQVTIDRTRLRTIRRMGPPPPLPEWGEPEYYPEYAPERTVTAGQPERMPETLNEPEPYVYTRTAPFGTQEVAGYAREVVDTTPAIEDNIGTLAGLIVGYLLFV